MLNEKELWWLMFNRYLDTLLHLRMDVSDFIKRIEAIPTPKFDAYMPPNRED